MRGYSGALSCSPHCTRLLTPLPRTQPRHWVRKSQWDPPHGYRSLFEPRITFEPLFHCLPVGALPDYRSEAFQENSLLTFRTTIHAPTEFEVLRFYCPRIPMVEPEISIGLGIARNNLSNSVLNPAEIDTRDLFSTSNDCCSSATTSLTLCSPKKLGRTGYFLKYLPGGTRYASGNRASPSKLSEHNDA